MNNSNMSNSLIKSDISLIFGSTITQIDRESIRSMVEDFWRSFLATAQTSPTTAQESILRFDEQIKSLATMMDDEQSKLFLTTIDEERQIIFDEYNKSPEKLKIRLGLAEKIPESIRTELISASDHDAILKAVQRDYADMQVIARSKGSVSELGKKIDQELDLRMRSYVVNMNPQDSAEFKKIYNLEHNQIVSAKLRGKANPSGCAVVLAVGLGICATTGSIIHYLI